MKRGLWLVLLAPAAQAAALGAPATADLRLIKISAKFSRIIRCSMIALL
jgi:hypothetical protein